MEQVYRSKRFCPDIFLDISSVAEKKWEPVRLIKCVKERESYARRGKTCVLI